MGAPPLHEEESGEDKGRKTGFSINDNADLLAEILGRLDGRSLAAASAVCRLWSAVCHRDSVWEVLCTRHSGGVYGGSHRARRVVAALGGYRRLYCLCVGPVLDRLAASSRPAWSAGGDEVGHLSLSLSLSLFSIDCYERFGGRPRSSSLLFLCKPVRNGRRPIGWDPQGAS